MLTVTRIGHCLFNYFSSFFKRLRHLSHRVVSAILCHFSDDEDIFLYCSVHVFEAGLKAGWVDEGKGGSETEWGLSDGLFFLWPISRPGKDEMQTRVCTA